jgi:hypothetical protein
MSEVRNNFTKAANARDWNGAFNNLNGLNMYEMLRALASLQPPLLDQLLKQSTDFWESVNMPRIAFAATVVRQRKIPAQVPGDLLATGQVQDAKNFLIEQERRGGGNTPGPTQTRAGQFFQTADQAAFAAIDEITRTSIANNWEYAGRIFQIPGGMYTFTKATTMELDAESNPGPEVPGYTNVGTYHTHAGGFFASDEDFSPKDKLKATIAKQLSYLGTPRGRILRFTPIDLLSAVEQKDFPTGRTEVMRIANILIVGRPDNH